MSSDPSPFFPPELEREIFEIAAYFHPETISSLVLVSRRVYEWIDGVKYNTVTSKGGQYSCSARHLLRAIRSNSKPASFFRHHVRNVFIDASLIKGSDMKRILSTCRGVQNLMTRNGDGETELIRGIVALKPRQLCIPEVFMLRETNPCWPMFTLLTHYDMFDLLDRMRPVSFFAQLPVLTHLSAYFNAFYFNIATRGDYTRKVREILTACRSLRVFVFFPLRVGDAMGSLPSIDDVRFVYIEFRHAMLEAGWLARTRGGTDHWARAEAFVEKKRRGEIQPASRCFIEPADGIPECGSF